MRGGGTCRSGGVTVTVFFFLGWGRGGKSVLVFVLYSMRYVCM